MTTTSTSRPLADLSHPDRRSRLIDGLRAFADFLDSADDMLDLAYVGGSAHLITTRPASDLEDFVDQAAALGPVELAFDDRGELTARRTWCDAVEVGIGLPPYRHELDADDLPAVRYAIDHGMCPICGELTLHTHVVIDHPGTMSAIQVVDPSRWHAEHDPCTSCDGTGTVRLVGAGDVDLGTAPCPSCGTGTTVARTCRVCGCTDDTACVDQAGRSCSWSEPDLCSACPPEDLLSPPDGGEAETPNRLGYCGDCGHRVDDHGGHGCAADDDEDTTGGCGCPLSAVELGATAEPCDHTGHPTPDAVLAGAGWWLDRRCLGATCDGCLWQQPSDGDKARCHKHRHVWHVSHLETGAGV